MRPVDENGGGRPAEFASDSVCLRFVLNGASIHLWQVRQIAFPFLSRQTFLTVCRDVLLVGVGDEELMRHILHLCSLTLPSGGCF